jgi:hypothetical protein
MLKKPRHPVLIAAGVGGVLAILWILFPPALHGRLAAIRRMQLAENSHMVTFLSQARAHPSLEPAIDADGNELEAYWEKLRKGPLADMPLRFDVNRYFDSFDRLKMDDGWVLDYVYYTTQGSAHPLLYARVKTNAPLPGVAAFEKAFGNTTDENNVLSAYLDRVRTDGSRRGFIQLTALRLVGDQFYLYWHANYNDARILSRFPAWVSRSKTEVSVSLLVFSKWGGVARYKVRFNRSFPHKLLAEQCDTLIPYNCGIRY